MNNEDLVCIFNERHCESFVAWVLKARHAIRLWRLIWSAILVMHKNISVLPQMSLIASTIIYAVVENANKRRMSHCTYECGACSVDYFGVCPFWCERA